MLPCRRTGCRDRAVYVPRLLLYTRGVPIASEPLGALALCAAHREEVGGPEDLLGKDYLARLAPVLARHRRPASEAGALEWERLIVRGP